MSNSLLSRRTENAADAHAVAAHGFAISGSRRMPPTPADYSNAVELLRLPDLDDDAELTRADGDALADLAAAHRRTPAETAAFLADLDDAWRGELESDSDAAYAGSLSAPDLVEFGTTPPAESDQFADADETGLTAAESAALLAELVDLDDVETAEMTAAADAAAAAAHAAREAKLAAVVSHYELIDGNTGHVISTHKKRPTRKQDRLDNAYGGYRYHVRPVWAD